MRPVFIFLVVIFIYSCSKRNKVPAGILQQEKMYTLLWDLARADALVSLTEKDTLTINGKRLEMYEQTFRLHGITREKFRESMDFYERNPEILKVMMDSLRNFERRVLYESEKKILQTQDTLRKPVRD